MHYALPYCNALLQCTHEGDGPVHVELAELDALVEGAVVDLDACQIAWRTSQIAGGSRGERTGGAQGGRWAWAYCVQSACGNA